MQLILGDSEIKLKDIPDNTIDLVVSDPPYQLDSVKNISGKSKSAKGFMGKDWDVLPPVSLWMEVLRTMKPGAFAFLMMTPRQDSLSKCIVDLSDAGFNTGFTSLYWTYAQGFPKAHNISKSIDKKLKKKPIDTGIPDLNRKGRYKGIGGFDGVYKDNATNKRDANITAPASDQAKQFEGSYGGYQPKPAVEVIIVVQKPPTEPTQVGQALSNAKGITWLDDCRIPYNDEEYNKRLKEGPPEVVKVLEKLKRTQGRFPANLLVSDDILNNYSRFFSLDAWAERNLPFLIVPKASKSEKSKGLETKNTHATVKPIKLLSYLITMGSRPGDVVLDPFMGSGSTGCAAVLLGRDFVGIEKDENSFGISKTRISYWERHKLERGD